MYSAESFQNGQVLLIDKPLGWTSFQVVNKLRWEIRRAFNLKKIKVGHAGTLDPLATGLLILCTGKKTKEIQKYQAQLKEYTGSLRLGATTPSYDLETEIDATYPTHHINAALIEEATKQFIGEIDQKPPLFSAVKKDGKRLYELAREGKTTEIASRKVVIEEFEILSILDNNIDFRVRCSKGTYIRSLVHDFGASLNSGAHLTALRRTKIGEFSIENALELNDFIQKLSNSGDLKS